MEIVIGRTTLSGVKVDDKGNIRCEKCGAMDDVKMIFHADATDYYISNFECECGNAISTRTERTEEEKMLWE